MSKESAIQLFEQKQKFAFRYLQTSGRCSGTSTCDELSHVEI